MRQVGYSTGPFAPFQSVSVMVGQERARRNRMLARGEALPAPVMEIGRLEGFRFIGADFSAPEKKDESYVMFLHTT